MTKTSAVETRAPWWTIPQALVWIVTRSESRALRAAGARSLANFAYITGLGPVSDPHKPPVSAAAAPDELQQAWTAGRITIFGREWGRGPSRSVPSRSDLRIHDHRAEVCIGDSSLYRGASPFWSNLCVRADDCKRCWPAPHEQAASTSRSLTGGSIPSDNDVLAFFEEKRKSLRAERKRAGRDVLLRAAMDQFGLSRKVVLDIWSSLPHDRKGGRPKKAKPVGFVRQTGKKAS
jgi:hypothetical protein